MMNDVMEQQMPNDTLKMFHMGYSEIEIRLLWLT